MEVDDYYSLGIVLFALIFGSWMNAILAALSSLSLGKIRKLDSQKRKPLVERAEVWLDRRSEFSITVRLLLFMSFGLLAMVLYHLAEDLTMVNGELSHDFFVILGVCALATLVFILIIESVASIIAAGQSWSLLAGSMPLIQGVTLLLYPVVRLTRFLHLRAENWGSSDEDDERPTTEDEILSLVEQDASEEEDDAGLEDSERRMIRGIFDLDQTIVREIMTPRVDVKGMSHDCTLSEASRRFIETGHSRIPVYNETVDNIIGLLFAKDLLDEAKLRRSPNIQGIMHDPYFVPETKDVKTLLEEFKQTRNQIAIVIDEYGGTAGIVTIEDILEEIVGEIQDEYDTHEVPETYVLAADGSVDVDARTPIDEVNELLEVDISDEEDYDTIGGCVNSELGRIPKTDEVVVIDGLEIQILEADERKISRLRLRKITEATAANDT